MNWISVVSSTGTNCIGVGDCKNSNLHMKSWQISVFQRTVLHCTIVTMTLGESHFNKWLQMMHIHDSLPSSNAQHLWNLLHGKDKSNV